MGNAQKQCVISIYIYIYIYMTEHTKCICNSHHANYTHYTVSEQYPFSASSINNLINIYCNNN